MSKFLATATRYERTIGKKSIFLKAGSLSNKEFAEDQICAMLYKFIPSFSRFFEKMANISISEFYKIVSWLLTDVATLQVTPESENNTV